MAVRYPPLNRQVGDNWIVGTHSSGGLEGLVGGYQLVVWKKPSRECLHARGADLSAVIEPLLQDLIDINGDDSSVLVMRARNEDRDQVLTNSICRGHPQIKVQWNNQWHHRQQQRLRPALSMSTATGTAGQLIHLIKRNAMRGARWRRLVHRA